jgi:hypothetical protein
MQQNPKARRKKTTALIEAYDTNHAKLVLDIWQPLIINIKQI